MAHGLRALAADVEDLGLVPSTYTGVHKHRQLLFQGPLQVHREFIYIYVARHAYA